MSTCISFVPPPWVAALLLRPPPPPTATTIQPRTTPSAMRDLVAQWLVHVTDDVSSSTTDPSTVIHAPHAITRFRGWLAFVFRLPAFIRRSEPSFSEQPQLQSPQFSLIERSLHFSLTIPKSDNITMPNAEPSPERSLPVKKRSKMVKNDETETVGSRFRLSPMYESLYFSIAGREEESLPPNCETQAIPDEVRDKRCVQSFFLMDMTGEGKGILDGLREMKAQGSAQRKRGWVPAVVSLILITLNPFK